MILAQREELILAQSEAKVRALEVERLKLLLAKARRETHGQSSERAKLLIEQLELAIEDLETTQAEEEAKAEISAANAAKERRPHAKREPRKLPENLPVERVVEKAPIALEAVRRIDELFEIESEINGKPPDMRKALRQARSKPLLDALGVWLREQRARVSQKSEIGKAINYSLNRWASLARFLDDGRICLSNNAAERGLRCVAVGRGNWTFAGSDEGAQRAARIYTLVETCKLNGVDPQAWLADALARLPDHPAKRIDELLPWNWKAAKEAQRAQEQKAA